MPLAAKPPKSTNINLRVVPEQRDLIDQAALLANKSRTTFILDAATREAENTILDQRVFALAPAQFRKLRAALDRKPAPNNRLRALLRRKPEWPE